MPFLSSFNHDYYAPENLVQHQINDFLQNLYHSALKIKYRNLENLLAQKAGGVLEFDFSLGMDGTNPALCQYPEIRLNGQTVLNVAPGNWNIENAITNCCIHLLEIYFEELIKKIMMPSNHLLAQKAGIVIDFSVTGGPLSVIGGGD